MASDFERLQSGEMSGKQYFQELEDRYVADGTLYRDEFGILQRSATAPPLSYLPGHEPRPPLTDKENAAVNHFLTMPPLYFDEEQ